MTLLEDPRATDLSTRTDVSREEAEWLAAHGLTLPFGEIKPPLGDGDDARLRIFFKARRLGFSLNEISGIFTLL